VFFTVLFVHLIVSFLLFGYVAPVEKAHLSAGIAGVVLKLLLFPLYLFVAVAGRAANWPGETYLAAYIGVFFLSGILWATLITFLFSVSRRPHAT
jgi:hypothetical protein